MSQRQGHNEYTSMHYYRDIFSVNFLCPGIEPFLIGTIFNQFFAGSGPVLIQSLKLSNIGPGQFFSNYCYLIAEMILNASAVQFRMESVKWLVSFSTVKVYQGGIALRHVAYVGSINTVSFNH